MKSGVSFSGRHRVQLDSVLGAVGISMASYQATTLFAAPNTLRQIMSVKSIS